jgi:hypothetical protein
MEEPYIFLVRCLLVIIALLGLNLLALIVLMTQVANRHETLISIDRSLKMLPGVARNDRRAA